MTVTSKVPKPIPALTPELFDALKNRIQTTLLNLISKNGHTRFVSEAPILSEFRSALAACADNDADTLVECYRSTIPFTSYDHYLPFVSKFTDNCKLEDVKDMFSPGLPWFIAITSSTSGGDPKNFAKYLHPASASLKEVDQGANPTSDTGGKNCIVFSLRYREVINILDDAGAPSTKIPVTIMSSGSIRMQNNVSIAKDPYIMHMIAPRSTSPVAVGFIRNYRAFLLTHILFALADDMLETINTLYGTMFIDMLDYMEEEWDTLVNSIETGVFPDWEGTSEVRHWLEPQFKANPERAAFIRSIGKTPEKEGWLQTLWPMLKVVIGVASGIFAAVIPRMRHYLGPKIQLRSLGFTASEAYVGTVYDPDDLNIFKVANDDIFEYLEITEAETPSKLIAGYEVEFGRRYEIIVTTRDGLWRYRLGDIVEIAGFDPTDGAPLVRYIERRNVGVWIDETKISEKQVVDSVFAAQDTLGPIVEFTVILDETNPHLLHYLIEIEGELSPLANDAPLRIEAVLKEALSGSGKTIPRPIVHLVKPCTFRDYRRVRIQMTTTGTGQVKVPVVMTNKQMHSWMFEHVDKVFRG